MNYIVQELGEAEKSIIAKTRILVIDSSNLTRSIISNSLKETGFKSITKVQNHVEAIEQFQGNVFDVVICEWDENEERVTLSLLSTVRGDDRFANTVLVVVCQAVSMEGLLKAAETDVDCFLPKPFTPDKLVRTVLTSIKNRLNPTPYKKKIIEAKALMDNKEFDKSQVLLAEAMKEDPKPSQAAYYLGSICIRRGKIKEAREYFEAGLNHRPYHLMCLFGMVFCCLKLKDDVGIYDTYKKILYLYPTHPQALEYILYVAISRYDLDSIVDIITQIKYMEEVPALVTDFVKTNGAIIIGLILNAKREDDLKSIYPIVTKILQDNTELRIKLINMVSRQFFAPFVKTELEELKSIAASNPDHLCRLSIVDIRELYGKEMFQDVVLECRRFLNKNKPQEDVYELLIESLEKLAMKDKAVESYKEAVVQLKNAEYLVKRFKGLVESVDSAK